MPSGSNKPEGMRNALIGKFFLLDIINHCLQTLGHPLVLMIYQLFPDIHMHVTDIQITQNPFIHQGLCGKIRQEGDHIAFGQQGSDHICTTNLQYRCKLHVFFR